MAKIIPRKPARTYPANLIHGIRVRLNATPTPEFGEIGLKAGKYHIGTIPRGAVILAASSSILTAFTAGATLNIGTDTVPDNIAKSADIAPATPVNAKPITPTLGYASVDTPLYLTIGGTAATAGVGDIVVQYYASRD